MFWEGDNNDGIWNYLIENKVCIFCKLLIRIDMCFILVLFLILFNYVKFFEVVLLFFGDIMVNRIVFYSLLELINVVYDKRNVFIDIWKICV